jgi:molybdopterin/thiamine biosynthesis adenylyltransferase
MTEERYARQTVLPQIGTDGQQRLARSTVAIVGLGGLGSCAAEMLARAGVGTLLLLDFDRVELSNLQRQSLYEESDVGKLKVEAAATHLRSINKEVALVPITRRIDAESTSSLDKADVILDCTDNLETRTLLNRHALITGTPLVICTVGGTRGMLYVVDRSCKGRACFECIFERLKPSQSPAQTGILGPTVHLAASLEAAEALKLLLGKPSADGLVSFDIWEPRLETFRVKQREDCMACSGRRERLSDEKKKASMCLARSAHKRTQSSSAFLRTGKPFAQPYNRDPV